MARARSVRCCDHPPVRAGRRAPAGVLPVVAAAGDGAALRAVAEFCQVAPGDVFERQIEFACEHGGVPEGVSELVGDGRARVVRERLALVPDELLDLVGDLAGLAREPE